LGIATSTRGADHLKGWPLLEGKMVAGAEGLSAAMEEVSKKLILRSQHFCSVYPR